MKYFYIAVVLLITTTISARPVAVSLDIGECFRKSDVVLVIRPEYTKPSEDLPGPNDVLFREPYDAYQGYETTCTVLSTLKGTAISTMKILHFARKDNRPLFNGSHLIFFHPDPVVYETFPREGIEVSGRSRPTPYAVSQREFIAFLRVLPDGRYAPSFAQYDAAYSFRLLSIPRDSERYYYIDGVKEPNKSPEPTPTAVTPRATEGKSK